MRYAMLGLVIAGAVAVVAAAIPPAAAATDPAAYFRNECVECHTLRKDPIDDKRMSRDEWKKSIDKMLALERLDPIPSKAFISELLDWLEKTHGPGAAPATPQATASEPANTK